MINDFLATLDNIAAPPGDIVWPQFTPHEVGPDERAVRSVILGTQIGRRLHFLRAVDLTYLVMNSPLYGVIPARDPRITYDEATFAKIFANPGTLITASGNAPIPSVVFGTSPGTPDVGTWVLSITALNTGTQDATVAISDDLGGRQSTSFSYTDHSPLIVLPDNKGSITFYGSNFALNDTWTIIRQSPMPSWAGEIYARVPDIEASALALMSPRLAAIYRGAPLGLDKLAAVVAALGGAV